MFGLQATGDETGLSEFPRKGDILWISLRTTNELLDLPRIEKWYVPGFPDSLTDLQLRAKEA